MTTTHDHRERELVKCDGCGRLDRRWHRLYVSTDGRMIVDAQLCRACETTAVDAVKLTISAVIR